MDPFRFLEETDPFVRDLAVKIAERVQALRLEMHDDLAVKIINTLGKALK